MKTASKINIYCVPGVHWDREWHKTFPEFQFHLVELSDMVLALLKSGRSIDTFHCDGYSALVEDYLAKRPEKLDAVRKYAAAGKLEIGPWYILSDMYLPSGESMIRNLEIGLKTARDFGMKQPGIPYAPDAFGHSSDVPKILTHLGFDSYFFCRGLGNQLKKPATEFMWRADDGAEVLALAGIIDVFDPPFDIKGKWACGAYGLGMVLPENHDDFRKRIELIMHHAGKFMTSSNLLMMCGCDHLLPQMHLKKMSSAFNAENSGTALVASTLSGYVKAFSKKMPSGLEHMNGELMDGRFLVILNGTGSSRIYLKQMNCAAQTLMEGYVEPWAVFASACGNFEYDKFIEDAWKLILKNQAHDSICGCSVDSVHLEMEQRYREVFQIADRLFERAAGICLGSDKLHAVFPREYPEIFRIGVFSALPWKMGKPFELRVKHPAEIDLDNYSLFDIASGREVDFSVTSKDNIDSTTGPFVPPCNSNNKLLAWTDISVDIVSIPACGYKLFEFRKQKKRSIEKIPVGPVILKNEFLELKINKDGTISVKSDNSEYRNMFCFEDLGDAGDEYVFMLVEKDDAVTNVGAAARGRWLVNTDFIQKAEITIPLRCPAFYDEKNKRRSARKNLLELRMILSLSKGSKRIDVVTEFNNNCRDHRLRVCFPLPFSVKDYVAQTQFGSLVHSAEVQRDTDAWREKPTALRRNLGWIALNDKKSGTSIAVLPKGLHEHAVEDNKLKLILLRSVGILGRAAGPGIPTPGAQCRGSCRAEYSLLFFKPENEDENYLWKEYQSYSRPPKSVIYPDVPAAVPAEKSFLALDSKEIVLSSVVKSRAKGKPEVRLFNVSGRKASGKLCGSFNKGQMQKLEIPPKGIAKICLG